MGLAADTRFPGTLNFRAVAPFSARDGARLVQGRLWRSGTFESVTATGIAAMRAHGIESVFDLRSAKEIDAHPAPFGPDQGIAVVTPRHSVMLGDLSTVIRNRNARPEDIRQAMIRVYRDMPHRFTDVLRAALEHAAEATTPMVINCTAGKDRTGVVVALILCALGVHRDDIIKDYLVSNEAGAELHRMLKGRRGGGLDYATLSDALLSPLHSADSDYLSALFDEVETQAGDIDSFLSGPLGLTSARRDRLAARFLES
jgi:protein-tyrosine phosphatase